MREYSYNKEMDLQQKVVYTECNWVDLESPVFSGSYLEKDLGNYLEDNNDGNLRKHIKEILEENSFFVRMRDRYESEMADTKYENLPLIIYTKNEKVKRINGFNYIYFEFEAWF